MIKKWRIREEVIPPGQAFDNSIIESYPGKLQEELADLRQYRKCDCEENILKIKKIGRIGDSKFKPLTYTVSRRQHPKKSAKNKSYSLYRALF